MKKTKLILIVSIVAVILVGALLCLWVSGYTPPAPKATEAKLPNGWEAVSTKDDVTFIQMKVGEKKEAWFEYSNLEFHINITLSENNECVAQTCGDDQFIEAIVYYGYGWINYDPNQDMDYLAPKPNPDSISSIRLIMEVEDGSSYTLFEDEEFMNTPSISYRQKDEQIGYTKAAIVRIPTTAFTNSADTPIHFVFRNARGTALGESTIYLTNDPKSNTLMAETFPTAREKHTRESFPNVILTKIEQLNTPAGFHAFVTYLVVLAVPITAILTAIKRRNRYSPYLIIIAYTLITMIASLFVNGSSWAGVAMFLMLVYYILPGTGIIAIFQLIIEGILRIRDRKAIQNQTATVDSPSPLPTADQIGAKLDAAENSSSDESST